MKLVLLAVSMVLGSQAFADGFVCQAEHSTLNVKIYNHVNASEGTRTGAIMVLSDSKVGYGRKTIATFTSVNSTLVSKNLYYQAKVDLTTSGAAGENIGGTKLGQLDNVAVALNFSYQTPVADGTEVSGRIKYQKTNGETWTDTLVCVRYLKN